MDPLLEPETGDGVEAAKFSMNFNALKNAVKKDPKKYAEYAARWLLFFMYAALAISLLVVTSQ